MPSHELQPYEEEESSFWPMSFGPLFRGIMPSMRGIFPTADLDVYEDKDHVVVKAPLPGLKSGDVDLSFEKGILTIHGQRKEEKEDKERKYFHKSSASYVYRLSVPGDIDEGAEPEAKLEEGVLEISFKKHKRAAPRKIQVKGV